MAKACQGELGVALFSLWEAETCIKAADLLLWPHIKQAKQTGGASGPSHAMLLTTCHIPSGRAGLRVTSIPCTIVERRTCHTGIRQGRFMGSWHHAVAGHRYAS